MTAKFNMVRDINGYNGFGRQSPDIKYGTILSANTEQHFTVPTEQVFTLNGTVPNSYLAIFYFQPGISVWVSVNATAEIPGASWAAVTAEGNPTAYMVHGGDTISMITGNSTGEVGVTFYALS